MSFRRRKRAFAAACVLLCVGGRSVESKAQASTSSAASSAPRGAGNRLRSLIAKVFALEEIKVGDGADDEQGYRFKVFNEKSRYARVVGPFEGYDDFFLLRGESLDYLIFIQNDCQPACEQHMAVYRFEADGAPVRIPLMKILELSRFPAVRRKLLALCLDPEENFDMNKSSRSKARVALPGCPFAFSFPKKNGSNAFLFEIVDENGSGFALSIGKTSAAPVAKLRWSGKQLIGVDPDDDASIFLGGARMDALF